MRLKLCNSFGPLSDFVPLLTPNWLSIHTHTHTHTRTRTHQTIQSLYNQTHREKKEKAEEEKPKYNNLLSQGSGPFVPALENLFAHNLFNKKPFDSVKQQQQE